MSPFQYDLMQQVKLVESDERGGIIARAEYAGSEPAYLVRYKDVTGAQVERWWCESALQAL